MAHLEEYEGHHHCNVFGPGEEHAGMTNFRKCTINPGHKSFMTIREFEQKGPSNFVPDEQLLAYVWNVIERTVKINVTYTSKDRPDTYPQCDVPYPLNKIRGSRFVRSGTGFLFRCNVNWSKKNNPCVCLQCKKKRTLHSQTTTTQQQEPAFSAYYLIVTATHVLFDSLESQNAAFEFFYDAEDRKGVKCVYGVCAFDNIPSLKQLETDMCIAVCVTHDAELAETLDAMESRGKEVKKDHVGKWWIRSESRSGLGLPFMVSHPHGVSKRISFGEHTGGKRFMTNKHALPITLKKGLRVRLAGNRNNEDIISILNLKPAVPSALKRTCSDIMEKLCCMGRCDDEDDDDNDDDDKDEDYEDDEDGSNTFTMLSDITIRSPLPITIFCIGCSASDEWWTIPPDVTLATDSGTDVILPPGSSHSGDAADGNNNLELKFQVFIKGSLDVSRSLRYWVENKTSGRIAPSDWRTYFRFNYNMAACPGSSGAPIPYPDLDVTSSSLTATHFGCLGKDNKNTSGLWGF